MVVEGTIERPQTAIIRETLYLMVERSVPRCFAWYARYDSEDGVMRKL
jgi:hypothetical protein